MALKVRDVRSLEAELRASARGSSGEIGVELDLAEEWFARVGGPAHIVSREALAQLCEVARGDEPEPMRELALGTLVYLQTNATESPELARFAACFSLRLLASATGRSLRWSGIPIRGKEAERASQIFERYVGKGVHDDEDLLACVQGFIDAHRGKSDMFGRLAHDLVSLSEIMTNPEVGDDARDLARAALDYFAVDADAIPDHLGVVGLLDDAFVVRRALDELRPGTAVIASFLDKAVEDWPFLIDLAFGDGLDEWPLSEFLLVNAGLLTSALRTAEGRRGHALVAPEPGPLPMLLGWIASLAEVQSFLEDGAEPDFEPGARLAHRDSGAELLFHGYVRLGPKGTPETCDRSEATHFKAEHLGRGKGGNVTRMTPISELAVLRRSGRKSESLRRGGLDLRVDEAELGPLERVFAQPRPIVMPAIRRHVIVVSAIAEARSVAQELGMWDVPLVDIVPIEQARWDDGELVTQSWSRDLGGDALVTVVRTAEEALELVETSERETRVVVAGVRSGSTDATHLARIAGLGTPVMAIVEERDTDAQEAFDRLGFDFWSWDDDWLGTVRWPEVRQERGDIVSGYEARLRRRASARVEVELLALEGTTEAQKNLRELERWSREHEDAMLEELVGKGFSLFVGLLRCLGDVAGLAAEIETYRARVEQESRWWEEEIARASRDAAAALDSIAKTLARRNPKREFLEFWHRRHPDGFVVARRRSVEEAKNSGLPEAVQWTGAAARGSRDGAGLVSAWLGAETMMRLLVPPISESVTLLFYEPEQQWYQTLRTRRGKACSKLRQLVRKRSLVPLEVLADIPEPEPPPSDLIPDEVIDRARTASVTRRLGSAGSDPIEAKLFYFVDGSWAPFALDHRVNDVTHLIEDQERGDEKVREVRAADLRPGSTILVHLGVEHDAIRHAADAELAPGLREAAGIWRRAVQRFLERYDVGELHDRLVKRGCKRDPLTIRGWERDEYIIGPIKEADTVRAILSATQDGELEQRVEDCLSAIREVRHAHNLAARALARRVLARAKSTLRADGSDGVDDLGEGLVLLTVDSIESKTITVARSVANRVHDA